MKIGDIILFESSVYHWSAVLSERYYAYMSNGSTAKCERFEQYLENEFGFKYHISQIGNGIDGIIITDISNFVAFKLAYF